MTRTDDEIRSRIAELEHRDFFGFVRSDLIDYLPYADAKPFLKEGVTEADWTPRPRDDDAIIGQIREYMPFAWEKANDCRGLSASRSMNHMQAWLWMLGHDEAAAALDDYELYGKPQLRAICERFDIDWRALDDGRWTNHEIGDGMPAPEASIDLPFGA